MSTRQAPYRRSLAQIAGTVLNVFDFAPGGDPTAVASGAWWDPIRNAVRFLQESGGGKLVFPVWDYTIGYDASSPVVRDSSMGVIDLSPWQDDVGTWHTTEHIEIRFEQGARLIMDNLMPNGYDAQTHAIYARCHWTDVGGNATPTTWGGYAVGYHDIQIINPTIEWTLGSARGVGDAIRFTGTKSESTAPYNLTVVNPVVRNSPQTSFISCGCKRVTLSNMRAENCWADTAHFNANFEGCKVNGVTAIECEDDTLAVVTYYPDAITLALGLDTEDGPFTSPDQTTANNNGLQASHITKIGGNANAVRFQGANRASVTTVYCDASGDPVDAAIWCGSVLANGTTLAQTSMACVGCTATDITAKGCEVGQIVIALGFVGSENDTWLRNEITLRDIRSTGATQYSFLAQATRGFKVFGAECETMKSFFIDSSDFRIDNWQQKDTNVEIYGVNSSYYDTASIEGAPWHNIRIGSVRVTGGLFLVRNARGVFIDGEVVVEDAPEQAIQFERVTDIRATSLRAINPNRLASASINAVRFLATRRVSVARAEVNHDSGVLNGAWEFGGGDAYNTGTDIRASLIHRTEVADSASRIVVQGGGFAPTDLYYSARYRNAAGTWTRLNYEDIPLPVGTDDLIAYGVNLGAVYSAANPVGSWLLERSAGASGSYLVGIGVNCKFDGSNWVTGGDGASNGGSLIVSSYGDGAIQFYTFPSTGGTAQTITNANLINYRRGFIESTGKLTMVDLKATGLAGTARPARIGTAGDITGGQIALTSTNDVSFGAIPSGSWLKNSSGVAAAATVAASRIMVSDGSGNPSASGALSASLVMQTDGAGLPTTITFASLATALKSALESEGFVTTTAMATYTYSKAESDLAYTPMATFGSHTHTTDSHTHGGVTTGTDTSSTGGGGSTSTP